MQFSLNYSYFLSLLLQISKNLLLNRQSPENTDLSMELILQVDSVAELQQMMLKRRMIWFPFHFLSAHT